MHSLNCCDQACAIWLTWTAVNSVTSRDRTSQEMMNWWGVSLTLSSLSKVKLVTRKIPLMWILGCGVILALLKFYHHCISSQDILDVMLHFLRILPGTGRHHYIPHHVSLSLAQALQGQGVQESSDVASWKPIYIMLSLQEIEYWNVLSDPICYELYYKINTKHKHF